MYDAKVSMSDVVDAVYIGSNHRDWDRCELQGIDSITPFNVSTKV